LWLIEECSLTKREVNEQKINTKFWKKKTRKRCHKKKATIGHKKAIKRKPQERSHGK